MTTIKEVEPMENENTACDAVSGECSVDTNLENKVCADDCDNEGNCDSK